MDISAASLAASTGATGTGQSRVPIQVLGQEDFLKLLVAQMTSQDPMSPTKDTEFIAQMAQFSSLEQAKTMQSDIARLRADQQFLQAQGLLGKTVDLQVDQDTTARGLVTAVQIDAGTPLIMVNGQAYDLSQVLMVSAASDTAQP